MREEKILTMLMHGQYNSRYDIGMTNIEII